MDTTNDIIKVKLITLIPQSNNNRLYLMKKKYIVHMSQTELIYIQSSINANGVFDTSTYKTAPYYLFKPVFKKILNDKTLKVKTKILIISAIVVGDKPDKQQLSYDIPNEIYTKNDGNIDVNLHFIMAILSNGIIHFINHSCIIKLRYCQYVIIKNKITSNCFEVINTTDYNFGLNQLTFNEQIDKLSSIAIPRYYITKVDFIN
jgi:hypothetical protein